MPKVEVAKSGDVEEGQVFATEINGRSLIVTRVNGRACTVENKCSHLGWSMTKGTVSGSTITCPWHGSKFDVCTGENIEWVNSFAGISTPKWTHKIIAMGKAPAPIKSFETSEEAGVISVGLP
jgi:nitrite reductase/ring-hydroxylating ferredoxin subunit